MSTIPTIRAGQRNTASRSRTLRRLGLDLTGDGRVDDGRRPAPDRDRAVAIFIEHYFKRPDLDPLPQALQPSVFDMYVNAGSNAVRILQRLVTRYGLCLHRSTG